MDVVVKARSTFFDSAAVVKRLDAGTRRVLSKLGAFVRRRARSSMRKRKKPSKPGAPPSVHQGQLKNLLFFSYDFQAKSVVVGPVPFRGPAVVPGLMEAGGTSLKTVRVYPNRGRAATPRQKEAFLRGVRAGAIIPRKAQTVQVPAKYAPRPFMAPALQAEMPKFRDQLRNLMR